MTLLTGTAGGQVIILISMPVISRLYSPADFGVYAVLNSVIAILGVAACLRYDVALALPRRGRDAVSLLCVGFLSLVLFSVIAPWFSVLVTDNAGAPIKYINEGLNFVIVVFGIFAFGGVALLQSWFIRRRRFILVSRNKVIQSFARVFIQIIAGVSGFVVNGLLLGVIVGYMVGFALYAKSIRLRLFGLTNRRRVFEYASRYRKYPIYSTWEALANASAIYLPIIIMARYLPSEEVGYLNLAMMILQAPVGLIATSAAQIFLSEAPKRHAEGTLKVFFTEIVWRLAKMGVLPFLLVLVVLPFGVSEIFGDKWEPVGAMIIWMLPWFFMQLVASPVSMSFHVLGRQELALVLQVFSLLTRLAFIYLCVIYFESWVVEGYAISGFVVYLIYFLVVYFLVKRG
ncbi:lipopolysaccharide biosynthesis protein [Brachymonas denitrificans]|uniref:lipopolysaccharide biosynthesis protein n=1 Tax=Brachymonas denitrificans TaxID=28220 RepID=UPI0013564B65|nr:oligosaccharide flippase family protein [Brachymonas denitrificans]